MPKPALPTPLALTLCLLLGTSSCELPLGPAGSPEPAPEVEEPAPYRWWDHPDAIEDCLLAIGSTGIGSHAGMSRNAAMIEGRSKLRVTLDAKAKDLIETWLENTERSADLPGLRRVVNGESFLSRITAPLCRNAPVLLVQEERNMVFSLVALESPKGFLDTLSNKLKAEIIDVETFFPEEEAKQSARADLDELVRVAKENIKGYRAEFGAGPIETEPEPKRGKR